jgi:HEAT repeat protein
MKNKSKNTKKQKANCTRLIVTYAFMTYIIFAFGCNKPSRPTIGRPAVGRPDNISVDTLLPEATRIVQEGLADEDPLIRANAIEVVAVTKRTKLMPKVVRRLLKDEFVPVRFVAALAVGDLEYSLAESSVAQLLKDENENVRIAAAYALSKLGSPESAELFRNAIASNDQTVKANAALLLGKSGDKSAETRRSLWWTLSRDSDDKVIFQAAEAIAMLGDERIYPKLWTMLISKYADVRVIGIRAMGALGTVEAKNALIRMLDDDILEVRLAAAEQLGALKETIGEPEVLDVFTKNLTARLNKKALERINVRTALAIGRIGTPRLIKYLPQLLKDEAKSVRIAAAMAVFQCITEKEDENIGRKEKISDGA